VVEGAHVTPSLSRGSEQLANRQSNARAVTSGERLAAFAVLAAGEEAGA
jgi:hypothetical protein